MKFSIGVPAKWLYIAVLALISGPAFAQVSISVDVAPPPLPFYQQPACPNDGYLWMPGYWAYGDYGYFWVPGTWVQPPQPGLLWTPGYWGWSGNNYAFYPGYWGTNVGFYGGVDYGYGYGGDGYGGGRWQGRNFFYNTSVNNIGSGNIRNRYADASAVRREGSASYNGGDGGVQAQPSAQQRQFASEQHVQPTAVQAAHIRAASIDRSQLASVNKGRPATPAAATPTFYKRVAQQHAATQPVTKQDSVKEQQVHSASNTSATSPSPQADAESQRPAVSQNPPPEENRDVIAQPQEKPVMKPQPSIYNTQPRPETEVAPQSRPEAQSQPRPAPAGQPQSHPQAEVAPRPQAQAAPRPEAGAKPQGQANKPQAN